MKTNYVTCKCGNVVLVEKRHDFSVLPCPECREKEEEEKILKEQFNYPYSVKEQKENENWKTGVNLEDDAKVLLIGIICFLILVISILGGFWLWRFWG